MTFHAIGHSDLTDMVNNSRRTAISKHCLCTMFGFQPSSLHISKNILYDSNNFFSSWLYHICTTSFQGRQWVVGFSYYYIMGDNLIHNFQKTILMLGITSSMVKIVKQETNISHIFLQCSNVLAFFAFIEFFNSSSGDDFTPLPSSTKFPSFYPC